MKENKMKPKRTQRHARPQWEGKGVTTADKTSLSQAKPTSRVSSPAHVKPFAGKVFYLDLPSNRTAEMLESDIKELGGTVEKFFSKEIKYLVSNKKEARYVHCLRQDSPVPSPVSTQSSPHPRSNPHHPGSHGDNIKSRSQGQTDTFVTSRGKSLVERVVKEQERVQMNKILSNALEWGVKILYLHDVLAYVHKKKKLFSSHCPATTAVKTSVKGEQATKQSLQKCKGGRFSKPFIKVEDSSRHYRPIYLTMPNMPEFNLKTIPPCSPFCANDKDPPRNKQWEHRGEKASASDERAHGRKKNRDKKRGGYCECCMIKYENLTMHLQSERHKAFSRSDEYLVVDRLVSTLHCNFIHIKTKVRRPKCSVSSVLVAPGPCEKPELRDMRDFNKKQDQQWAVDKDDGSFSEHPLKVTSVPGSAHPIHTVGDRKNCYPYSYTSKHKSLARKRPCRQNSSTSCTQKAEQGQSPQLKTETAPSTGECLGSFPSTVTQADPVDPVSHKEMNSSASLFHNMDLQNEVSSKNLHVMTNHQEDFLLFEAIPDGNIFLEKSTGNNLTEREEGSLHTQSLSPVRKIQRKIRVYKRKRQKVDTHLKHLKPNNVPDHSILKLWELFQSSDDMDVEFHGFED